MSCAPAAGGGLQAGRPDGQSHAASAQACIDATPLPAPGRPRSVFLNFPAGIFAFLVLLLAAACLVLAGGFVSAAALLATNDGCRASDALVLSAVSPASPLFTLARFYLQVGKPAHHAHAMRAGFCL
jgi:hypothetical protein